MYHLNSIDALQPRVMQGMTTIALRKETGSGRIEIGTWKICHSSHMSAIISHASSVVSIVKSFVQPRQVCGARTSHLSPKGYYCMYLFGPFLVALDPGASQTPSYEDPTSDNRTRERGKRRRTETGNDIPHTSRALCRWKTSRCILHTGIPVCFLRAFDLSPQGWPGTIGTPMLNVT